MGFRLFVCLFLLSIFIASEVNAHHCFVTTTSTLASTLTVCGNNKVRPTGLICCQSAQPVSSCSWTLTRTRYATCTPVVYKKYCHHKTSCKTTPHIKPTTSCKTTPHVKPTTSCTTTPHVDPTTSCTTTPHIKHKTSCKTTPHIKHKTSCTSAKPKYTCNCRKLD